MVSKLWGSLGLGFWIFAFCYGAPARCLAVLPTDFESLRDVDLYLRTEVQGVLSPAFSASLLSQGLVRDLYQLGENRGELAELGSSKELAKDPVIALVRFLFYMNPSDSQNLGVSTRPTLFSTRLRESTVSLVLKRLLLESPVNWGALESELSNDLLSSGQSEKISRELLAPWDARLRECGVFQADELRGGRGSGHGEGVTFEALGALSVKGNQAYEASCKSYGSYSKVKDELLHCRAEGEANNAERVTALEGQLRTLLAKLKMNLQCCEDLKAFNAGLNAEYNGLSAKEFLVKLKNAVEATQKPGSRYLPALPYHLLTARILHQSQDLRQSVAQLWGAFPEVLLPEARPLLVKIAGDRTNEDPVLLAIRKQQKKSEKQSSRYLSDRLLGLKLETTFLNRFRPRVFNQGLENTAFRVGRDGPEVVSSDCCEATFFNFPLHFQAWKKKGLQPSALLSELWTDPNKAYPNPKDPDLRRRLKEGLSHLPGAQYAQVSPWKSANWAFDLNPTVDNFLTVMQAFFPGLSLGGEASRTKKLEQLCKLMGCKVLVEGSKEPALDLPWTDVKLQFIPVKEDGTEESKEFFEKLTFVIDKRHCFAMAPPNLKFNQIVMDPTDELIGELKSPLDFEALSQILAIPQYLPNRASRALFHQAFERLHTPGLFWPTEIRDAGGEDGEFFETYSLVPKVPSQEFCATRVRALFRYSQAIHFHSKIQTVIDSDGFKECAQKYPEDLQKIRLKLKAG